VKGEYNVYPSPHLTIIPNTKEHTHTIIPNIKKRQEFLFLFLFIFIFFFENKFIHLDEIWC